MTPMGSISYAVPPSPFLWKWSETFDAIEWHDGSTLAMWEEVHTILNFFDEKNGLPRFGAILLLIAACKDDWQLNRISRHKFTRHLLGIDVNDPIPEEIAEVLIAGLDEVNELPKDLRSSLGAKCHLASIILEGGPHSLGQGKASMILEFFSTLGPGRLANSPSPGLADAKQQLTRDLRSLGLRLKNHDRESLESLIRTGLESRDIAPPTIEEAVAEPYEPKLLLDKLTAAGGESAAAAKVAKRAIAMLNFPGHLGAPRDLPVGGIADITNRGTVDRLLPGELAWDDLVLAARLVHNEALYFRREIPPMNVAVAHTILLSRELRLWGAGRVLSLGIALGLWHHPALNGAGETFECVAATATDFEHLELDTRAKVAAALEPLIPIADPTALLHAWWDSARIVDDPAIPDVSFIVEKSHLDDPGIRTLLGDISVWIHSRGGHFRIIAIDRHGSIEVQAWIPGGHRTVFRGEIDLEEILNGARAKEPVASAEKHRTVQKNPAGLLSISPVYGEEKLPFLFPVRPESTESFLLGGSWSGESIGVSNTKQLASWPSPGKGGRILSGRLPGKNHWMGMNASGDPVVIASASKPGEQVRAFALQQGKLEEIHLEASRHPFPRHAAVEGNHVILVYSDEAEVISLTTGRRIHQQPIDPPPVHAILHFDTTKVMVLDGGQKTSLLDAWGPAYGHPESQAWPSLLRPDYVSLKDGILRILCDSRGYQFDPIRCEWQSITAAAAGFTNFLRSSVESPLEENLMLARLGIRIVIWHDPVGLLHLKNVEAEDHESWSILLSAPQASIWNSKFGLVSLDDRLDLPKENQPQNCPRIALSNSLEELSQHAPI